MLEKYSDQIVGGLLAGGGAVLSAGIAWLWKRSNEWWRYPRITIEVGNGVGFIYENVLIKTLTNGDGFSKVERTAVFVRAKVINKENTYRTPEKAKGCVGYLAALEQWDAAKSEFLPSMYQDFLRLEWSFNKETLGLDLLPGIPAWLDIVYVLPGISLPVHLTQEERQRRTMRDPPLKPSGEPTVLKIASNPPVNRYSGGFEFPGAYKIKVQVSGENFGSVSIQFYIVIGQGSFKPEVLDETSWLARIATLKDVERVQSNTPEGMAA